MVTLRKRARADETSGYEQCRDQRIKENMERMKKLGILDLSLKLKSELPPPPRRTLINQSERKTPQRSPFLSSEPSRRSSRLQNVTPVSYSEMREGKKEKSGKSGEIMLKEGSKPEFYTEEHDKLLITCESSWTLFVDGYGNDGRRIYDPVKGKTCHQCRQKTLGHRTHCIKCNLVQGQFCGDCLYMRYGENVLEANKNPSWICPVCRGICNCSLCRQSKGWAPTGALYRKVSGLGFKSVAHYLIQTRRSQTDSEDTDTGHPVSAKRSLPFEDSEEHYSLEIVEEGHHGSTKAPSKGDKGYELKEERKEMQSLDSKHEKPAIGSSDTIAGRLRQRRYKVDDGHDGCSKPAFEDKNDDEVQIMTT